MDHRRLATEDDYEEDEVRSRWQKWVRSVFGADDSGPENDRSESDIPMPSRKPRSTERFLPIGPHRSVRISVKVNASSMEDARDLVDALKDRAQVIMNLEGAPQGMDRRILDFVSGACQALDGAYAQVGSKVFLFAPSNVYIESDSTSPHRQFSFMEEE